LFVSMVPINDLKRVFRANEPALIAATQAALALRLVAEWKTRNRSSADTLVHFRSTSIHNSFELARPFHPQVPQEVR